MSRPGKEGDPIQDIHLASDPQHEKGRGEFQGKGKGKSHCSAQLLSRRSHLYEDGNILRRGRSGISRSSRCWNKGGANAEIRKRPLPKKGTP